MEEKSRPSFRSSLIPGTSANWLDEVRAEVTNRKILWVIAWLAGLAVLGWLLKACSG